MKASLWAAAFVAMVAFPAWAAVGSIPLSPGGIEVEGRLSALGKLRVTILLVPPASAQRAIHVVRLTALPSGTPLATIVVSGAPAEIAEASFETTGAVLMAPVTTDALSVRTEGPPPGDTRIRVEYLTQLETGERETVNVGEAQFPSLESFHFSFEPALDTRMPPNACGFCGDNRCGCSSCSEIFVCCPSCLVRCAPPAC